MEQAFTPAAMRHSPSMARCVDEQGDLRHAKVASMASGRPVEVASFATQTARYVKVANTGSADHWWSIAEFTAYA
ncbi:hypothetical protein AB0M32_14700 [Streptomyces sp. NPDC051985]|uniref:hypothetical protein n=1 Tax=Streptomyces sp. NPDC051985 TaxID=3155807 RepID=UPI003425083D